MISQYHNRYTWKNKNDSELHKGMNRQPTWGTGQSDTLHMLSFSLQKLVSSDPFPGWRLLWNGPPTRILFKRAVRTKGERAWEEEPCLAAHNNTSKPLCQLLFCNWFWEDCECPRVSLLESALNTGIIRETKPLTLWETTSPPHRVAVISLIWLVSKAGPLILRIGFPWNKRLFCFFCIRRWMSADKNRLHSKCWMCLKCLI